MVPGNDDAGRAISLYCDLVARAVIDGISPRAGRFGHRYRRCRQAVVQEELPAATAGFQGLAGPRGPADDLKKLPGVSVRSRRSSTISASSTTGSLPNSITTPPTRSAKKSGFRAAPMPGSPRPRRSPRKRNNASASGGRLLSRPPLRFTTHDISLRLTAARQGPRRICPDRQEGRSRWQTQRWRAITAAMVKDLRESTGAGMMDCKAALTETGGDMAGGAGLAAQEGPLQGRQEGRPRRRGRPDRRR